MSTPRIILVPAPAHLVKRGYPIQPLTNLPPALASGNVAVAPDPKALHKNRAKIKKASEACGYWATTVSFSLPSPARIIDLDFMLLMINHVWLQQLGEAHPTQFIDVILQVFPACSAHPARQRLMSISATPFAPGPNWPTSCTSGMLDKIRKLATAGYLVLEHDFTRSGGAGYLVQPTQAGLVRAVWLADLLEAPLPLIA